MVKRRILIALCAVLAAGCVFPNDLDYPRVVGNIVSLELEGAKEVRIDAASRQVSIVLRDNNLRRLEYLSGALARELAFLPTVLGPYPPMQEGEAEEHIRLIRLMLPRDKALKQRKKAIAATVAQFEKERKYTGHIVIDVDPA